jgi:serine/threonine protein kinase
MTDKSGKTSIMNDGALSNRATSPMESNPNPTAIMGGAGRSTFSSLLSEGQWVCGRLVERVIAENTGEATLLLAGDVVIKVYHVGKQPKEQLAKVISSLDCPYITRPLETIVHGGRYCEILPFYAAGDLAALKEKMSDTQIINLVVPSVKEGLNVLHNAGIVHRDIKPSNLFFSNALDYVIIGDFGISSMLDPNLSVRATTMSRTFGYAAPETSAGFISKESDYYSFGITLLHLATGLDPFAGMTDAQILNLTINRRIEIPGFISDRISTLIKGLTLKERSDRWGYDEVTRWLNNEAVELKESKKVTGIKPYNFNKEKYYNLVDISKAFSLDWDNTKKHLYRGLVDKYLLNYGEEITSNCMDLKEITDKDVAVFKLIYLLNPYAPLSYRGRIFNDLEHLANVMHDAIPGCDSEILEMLKNGCLEHYIQLDNAYDKDIVSVIADFANKIREGNNDYYYAIMYYLNPYMGYVHDKVEFKTVMEVVDYLIELDEEKEMKFAKELMESQEFFMWVASKGYSKIVDDWKNIYNNSELFYQFEGLMANQ